MRCTELLRGDQEMGHSEKDLKVGDLDFECLPRAFPFLQGVPKSWWAVLHLTYATCKWMTLWAQRRLDFIWSPSLNAATWFLPHSQVLFTVLSWDLALCHMLFPHYVFPGYLVPHHDAPRKYNYPCHTHSAWYIQKQKTQGHKSTHIFTLHLQRWLDFSHPAT
jgi:hypothetical protein